MTDAERSLSLLVLCVCCQLYSCLIVPCRRGRAVSCARTVPPLYNRLQHRIEHDTASRINPTFFVCMHKMLFVLIRETCLRERRGPLRGEAGFAKCHATQSFRSSSTKRLILQIAIPIQSCSTASLCIWININAANESNSLRSLQLIHFTRIVDIYERVCIGHCNVAHKTLRAACSVVKVCVWTDLQYYTDCVSASANL